jgi:MYXO-CTERM domain-containing protein
MRSLIAFSLLVTVAAMSLPAMAQETQEPATTTNDDRDFDWGWLGLIGLVGLAGLTGRRRDANSAPRTTTTTR